MAKFELIMPKMGESIAEATIIRWLKNEGDTVAVDESVLEIATDKVDSEVPSPQAGILSKQLFGDGDVVAVGQAVAHLEIEGEVSSVQVPKEPVTVTETPPVVEEIQKVVQVTSAMASAVPPPPDRFYSPLVMNIARTEGIPMEKLESMPGSGKNGRVTKRDILSYLENNGVDQPIQSEVTPTTEPKSIPTTQTSKTAVSLNAGDEVIAMDRMRKLIAEHMVMSKQTSAHVTSFVEADVTNLVNWRNKHKGPFEQREGEKLTFTPLFVECLVRTIKDFPMVNIEVDGETLIKRKNINIGMAAALADGNLIVPVIKNADTKNLVGLTREVNDLANRARNNKLIPDEIQGGTYTLTNVGTFGNLMGTPIINQPQVAIMATGSIQKKPAVIETEYGDVIGIRHFMYLSHSYDHRVVDGALGGMFVRRMADYLEQWDVDREA